MTPRKLAATIALLLSLAGCANGAGQKQIGGTLLGGALGALAGSQIGSGRGQLAAVALGALGGAFLGSEVGKSLDRADRLSMQRTVHQALETNRTGVTATWNNPDSGHSGTVTPTQTFQTASGQFCREYQQTVTIGGKTEAAYTAPRAVKQTAPGGSSESQPPKALGKVENGTLRKRSEKPRISHPKPPPRDHSYGQQLPSG